MNRKEYTDAVLTALRHVTDRERLAIQAELDAHIEDHMAALQELDYPPELAEERALAAMGDPAEVGRELNACYQSWFWVILGRAAAVVTAVLCILALLHVGLLGMVADSISARIYPDEDSYFEKLTAAERLDIRVPVGNDVLHVYRISVGQEDLLGERVAEVLFCAYDRIPGGIVSQWLADGMRPLGSRSGWSCPCRGGRRHETKKTAHPQATGPAAGGLGTAAPAGGEPFFPGGVSVARSGGSG